MSQKQGKINICPKPGEICFPDVQQVNTINMNKMTKFTKKDFCSFVFYINST